MTGAASWNQLYLFVVRTSPRSLLAVENLRLALREFPERGFELEIIDVAEDYERALSERVLITPTLLAPASARRLVGDLTEPSQLHYFLGTLPLGV